MCWACVRTEGTLVVQFLPVGRTCTPSFVQHVAYSSVMLPWHLCRCQPESAGVPDSLKATLQSVQAAGGTGVEEAVIKDLKRRQLIEQT